MQLDDILATINNKNITEDVEVNRIIQTLRISTDEEDHVLLHASRNKKSIFVQNGEAEGCRIPEDLIRTLGESSFVVVPLYSPDKELGVIIVDNFVTRAPEKGQVVFLSFFETTLLRAGLDRFFKVLSEPE